VSTEKETPIPEEAPEGFFDKQKEVIADIGEPTTAGFLTGTHQDPTNWYIFYTSTTHTT